MSATYFEINLTIRLINAFGERYRMLQSKTLAIIQSRWQDYRCQQFFQFFSVFRKLSYKILREIKLWIKKFLSHPIIKILQDWTDYRTV